MKTILFNIAILTSINLFAQNSINENWASYGLNGKVKTVSTYKLKEDENGDWKRGEEYYQSSIVSFDDQGRFISKAEGLIKPCEGQKGIWTDTYEYLSGNKPIKMTSLNCQEYSHYWLYKNTPSVDTVFIYNEKQDKDYSSYSVYDYDKNGKTIRYRYYELDSGRV